MSGSEETPDREAREFARLWLVRPRRRDTAQFDVQTYNWDEILNAGVTDGERFRGTLSPEQTKHLLPAAYVARPPAGGDAVARTIPTRRWRDDLNLSRWLWASSLGRVRRGRAPVAVDPPAFALRLFSQQDAAHYAREWRAHLSELIDAGEHRQARKDRRRLTLRAPWLALELRARALLRRRLRSPR